MQVQATIHTEIPPGPQPEYIAMKYDEYMQVRADVAKLLDYHAFIRKVGLLLEGSLTPEEEAELRQSYQHFTRQYGGGR